ncbi:MAG: hypothetical protein LBG15_04825 [Dysgonamonadaceae bacterium]|nr:hypothetical protein [Dysgonamonadaceae bacterium]
MIDYDKLIKTAKAIEEGASRLSRLNRAEETGRITGGRTNVEASVVVGTEYRFVQSGQSGSYESIKKEAGKQKIVLKSYAEEKEKHGENIWYSSLDIERLIADAVEQTGGAEADVYLMPDKTVIKIIEHSNVPLEFLDDRISLYNYLFPETSYELIGFTDNPYNENLTSFIVRQRKVEGKTLFRQLKDIVQSEREAAEKRMKEIVIKKMLHDFGAVPAATDNTYKNNNYYIRDLHWENLMTTENILENSDTHLYVIDTNTSLNIVKEDGGIREYGDGKLIVNY